MIQLKRGDNDRILELGGGSNPLVHPACLGGRDVNVDVRTCYLPDGRVSTDFTADFNEPLPVGDGDFDGVVCIFTLEHISWRKVPRFVAEMLRVVKPGARCVVVVPNTEAQMKHIMAKPEWDGDEGSMLFGDLDYPENSHKSAFSPRTITKLFQDAGWVDVQIVPYGELGTDLCLTASRPKLPSEPLPFVPASLSVPQEGQPLAELRKPGSVEPDANKGAIAQITQTYDPARMFDHRYFDGGDGGWGGYGPPGYLDFPAHEVTARHVLARKPESVLELGPSRGYVLKRIEDAGIPVRGYDVSKHCWLTRVTDGVILHDITKTPWPGVEGSTFGDADLCFSVGVLEHLPEDRLPAVFAEMARTCRRGLHGIDFDSKLGGFDKTHLTFRPKSWWQERMPPGHEVVHKNELESGPLPADYVRGDGKVKLNIGSFISMYHHGWENIDLHNLEQWAAAHAYKYTRLDVRNGLPHGTETVDLIHSCHMLEHLTYAEGLGFLKECRRVLKPTGAMRIIVPNAWRLMFWYCGDGHSGDWLDDFDQVNRECGEAKTAAAKLWSVLCGGEHKAFYDAETLCHQLEQARFLSRESSFRNIGVLPYRPGQVEPNEGFRQMQRECLDLLPCLSLYEDAVPN